MVVYQYFYVDKTTQTFGDALVAFGLARLLNDLLRQQCLGMEYDVLIEDMGAFYQIICSPPLEAETVANAPKSSFIPLISTATNAIPSGINVIDYEEQRTIADTYFQALRKGNEAEKPHRHLPIYKAIVSKDFSARIAYNKLAANWNLISGNAEAVETLLSAYTSVPNYPGVFDELWKEIEKKFSWKFEEATRLQLFNPESGKGQNSEKANEINEENRSLKRFWFGEFLKAAGFYEAAMIRRIGKDTKTYVVSPQLISFEVSQTILSEFINNIFASTSVGLDVLAVIAYTQALIKRYLDVPNEIALEEGIWVPQKVVSGFYTAYYKSLNAVATMNISFIALPDWVEIQTEGDANFYFSILDELAKIVRYLDRQLDTSPNKRHVRSQDDVTALLNHLRDFISGRNLSAFWKFSTSYAGYYMRMREKGEPLSPLSYKLVERIVAIMRKSYADIADKTKYPGFHNIARAISESTVWAQWRKSQKNTTYNIRYGLNQELARKAHQPDQFVATIAEFLHTYNAETSRAQELGLKPWRPMVEASDIGDLLRMIDDYDHNTSLVAHLLIAYGYTFMKDNSNQPNKSENSNQENVS